MTERKRTSILVVEDEPAVAQVVKGRLELEGYDVHLAATGAAALSHAAEHQTNLVILDLRLPDMSGLQVARHLRKMSSPWELPIVMLTANHEPVTQLYGFAHGADAYLTKPYNPVELVQTVRLCLGETVGNRG